MQAHIYPNLHFMKATQLPCSPNICQSIRVGMLCIENGIYPHKQSAEIYLKICDSIFTKNGYRPNSAKVFTLFDRLLTPSTCLHM